MYQLIISLLLFFMLGMHVTYADPTSAELADIVVDDFDSEYAAFEATTVQPDTGSDDSSVKNLAGASVSGVSSDIFVYVSEMIPGATCNCVAGGTSTPGVCPSNIAITERKYKCRIEPGLSSFQSMFAGIIRYLIYIVLLLGVLAIAGLGVAWGWTSGDDAKMKSALKKWGANILAGLIILFLFQYILRFIAPWIYQ